MATVKHLIARQILDSRGIPTVEATLILDTGHVFSSSVPAGTSTGKYEAVELRDGNKNRYFGMEVIKAVDNVNKIISPKIIGLDPSDQSKVDQTMAALDGTQNKSKLGANAILAVSQVACKAGAAIYNLHLFDYISKKYNLREPSSKMPTSAFNMINGGKHGAGNLDFQEFMIIPISTKSYPESLRLAVECYHSLEAALTQMNAIHSVGIEGGFAPNLFTNKDALEIIIESIRRTEYSFGKDVFLGLDVAASHFYAEGRYKIKDRPRPLSSEEFVEYYKELNGAINLFSIEDAFIEDDWKSWTTLTSEISQNTLIIGDDLLATNKERLQKAISQKACNAILVKPNQIGTITETIEVIKIAKEAGFQVQVSHRSGETTDTFIADFAVGVGADYTKFGAPSRGERTAKYNRLLEINTILSVSASHNQQQTSTQAPATPKPNQSSPQPIPAPPSTSTPPTPSGSSSTLKPLPAAQLASTPTPQPSPGLQANLKPSPPDTGQPLPSSPSPLTLPSTTAPQPSPVSLGQQPPSSPPPSTPSSTPTGQPQPPSTPSSPPKAPISI